MVDAIKTKKMDKYAIDCKMLIILKIKHMSQKNPCWFSRQGYCLFLHLSL